MTNVPAMTRRATITAMVSFCAAGAAFSLAAEESPQMNGLNVHNKGIGGQNSEQGKARFGKDVVALKPDYVFIYFGLNDALNEPKFVTLEKFAANLGWMVDQARSTNIKPVLCTIHQVTEEPLLKRHKPESYGNEGPNGKITRYSAAIRKLAKEKNVPFADFAKAVDATCRKTPMPPLSGPMASISRPTATACWPTVSSMPLPGSSRARKPSCALVTA